LTTSLQFSYRVRILTIVGSNTQFLKEDGDRENRRVLQINLNGPEFYVCLNKYYFSLNFEREIKPLLVDWYRDEKNYGETEIQTRVKE
jgi:hypothetical protein